VGDLVFRSNSFCTALNAKRKSNFKNKESALDHSGFNNNKYFGFALPEKTFHLPKQTYVFVLNRQDKRGN